MSVSRVNLSLFLSPHLPLVRNSILLAAAVNSERSASRLVCKQTLLVVRPQGREWALPRWVAKA